ncbi:hypothetical protein B0H67DRAFT_369572 [Lasiosphaeris hirsuta]|uniref:Uncharacterized protein n=1 Tax=Lasiosphaeris hirsuta TaxID=260670 RepID=A0AA39ZWQ0_9PEZI|nr:hypothetical protein B0H67DRAFT_369572 [Lasiosphaeris hirsuta]
MTPTANQRRCALDTGLSDSEAYKESNTHREDAKRRAVDDLGAKDQFVYRLRRWNFERMVVDATCRLQTTKKSNARVFMTWHNIIGLWPGRAVRNSLAWKPDSSRRGHWGKSPACDVRAPVRQLSPLVGFRWIVMTQRSELARHCDRVYISPPACLHARTRNMGATDGRDRFTTSGIGHRRDRLCAAVTQRRRPRCQWLK